MNTYERDGAWFTLHQVDKSNSFEKPATADEIAAAKPKAEPKADNPAPKPAPEKKAKAK